MYWCACVFFHVHTYVLYVCFGMCACIIRMYNIIRMFSTECIAFTYVFAGLMMICYVRAQFVFLCVYVVHVHTSDTAHH